MTPPTAPRSNTASDALDDRYLLGVDGGGTKTVAWLARQISTSETVVLGRGQAGSSNVRAVGSKCALTNLDLAVDAAWEESRLQPARVDAAVFAMSGAGRPDVQLQISTWAQQRQLAREVRIVHDGEAALAAAAPDGWGVALVVGTGSVAWGVDRHGVEAVAGGWGFWFGDEGSAFWLGQTALRAVAHATDRRGPSTALTEAFLQQLQVRDPREILTTLSITDSPRYGIAQLAAVVIDQAQQGDHVARSIVDQAVDHWESMIRCVAGKLSLGDQFPLALAGGVLCKSDFAREQLTRQMHDHQLIPDPLRVVPDPVAGCLKIASREDAREDAREDE